MSYKLKPVKWTSISEHSIGTQSPTHTYTIRYNQHEKSYQVHYTNHLTKTSDIKYCRTRAEAKSWVEHIHIPSKLLEWFDECNG